MQAAPARSAPLFVIDCVVDRVYVYGAPQHSPLSAEECACVQVC
jgi:hypothetical protein